MCVGSCKLIGLSCPQVTERVYKGIPEAMRGHVWCQLLDLPRLKAEQSGIYEVRTVLQFMSVCSVEHVVYNPMIVDLSLLSGFCIITIVK